MHGRVRRAASVPNALGEQSSPAPTFVPRRPRDSNINVPQEIEAVILSNDVSPATPVKSGRLGSTARQRGVQVLRLHPSTAPRLGSDTGPGHNITHNVGRNFAWSRRRKHRIQLRLSVAGGHAPVAATAPFAHRPTASSSHITRFTDAWRPSGR